MGHKNSKIGWRETDFTITIPDGLVKRLSEEFEDVLKHLKERFDKKVKDAEWKDAKHYKQRAKEYMSIIDGETTTLLTQEIYLGFFESLILLKFHDLPDGLDTWLYGQYRQKLYDEVDDIKELMEDDWLEDMVEKYGRVARRTKWIIPL
jgi:hypothetical protein